MFTVGKRCQTKYVGNSSTAILLLLLQYAFGPLKLPLQYLIGRKVTQQPCILDYTTTTLSFASSSLRYLDYRLLQIRQICYTGVTDRLLAAAPLSANSNYDVYWIFQRCSNFALSSSYPRPQLLRLRRAELAVGASHFHLYFGMH